MEDRWDLKHGRRSSDGKVFGWRRREIKFGVTGPASSASDRLCGELSPT
jgi:hypothetical protein